jgi:hypothetical protein
MIDIQACPFCGSNQVECVNAARCMEPVFAVICRECGALGPSNQQLLESDLDMIEEAIIAWNRAR